MTVSAYNTLLRYIIYV